MGKHRKHKTEPLSWTLRHSIEGGKGLDCVATGLCRDEVIEEICRLLSYREPSATMIVIANEQHPPEFIR